MANCITKHIPNTLTSLNLISGCLALMAAHNTDYMLASTFIVIGAVFDFFDGMSARLLKVSSPIGKELDSLADCVTFGVAPSMIAFSLMSNLIICEDASWPIWVDDIVPLAAFIMAAFSALRLAKFNLDERQTTSFIGLPTPANALFWIGVAAAVNEQMPIISNVWSIMVLVFIFSWLLIAEIPMFSFKFKSLGWKENWLRYLYVIIAVPTIIIFGVPGLSIIIAIYILMSLIFKNK